MAENRLRKKLSKLKDILLSYKEAVVAYSGGADSTFLLKCCSSQPGSKVLAVTAVSPTYTRRELKAAKEIAADLGVVHKVIRTSEFDDPNFKANPRNRCYYCKLELFSRLKKIAGKNRIEFVLDGSNADDTRDYRPGSKAKLELGVVSPLAEAGLTKSEIRRLSRQQGLKTWDTPQAACLASRFPYGQTIRKDDLSRVEKAENYLHSLGFKTVRLRHYRLPDNNILARIEVDRVDLKAFLKDRTAVTVYLRGCGYDYITLDLEGYKPGSMNVGFFKFPKSANPVRRSRK